MVLCHKPARCRQVLEKMERESERRVEKPSIGKPAPRVNFASGLELERDIVTP
jgi:hypothetical protein